MVSIIELRAWLELRMSAGDADAWLRTPHAELDGETPEYAISIGQMQRVEALVTLMPIKSMPREKLARVQRLAIESLHRLESQFASGVMLTLIARHPDFPDGTVVVTKEKDIRNLLGAINGLAAVGQT